MTDITPDVLRAHAEQQYADELTALAAADDRPRPPSWRLSPWAVALYALGGELPDGTVVEPKYFGSRRLVEIAVATLATDRALLLLGVPGTAKTWLGEASRRRESICDSAWTRSGLSSRRRCACVGGENGTVAYPTLAGRLR